MEHRIALDGRSYTEVEFQAYYGDELWQVKWNAALSTSLSKPGPVVVRLAISGRFIKTTALSSDMSIQSIKEQVSEALRLPVQKLILLADSRTLEGDSALHAVLGSDGEVQLSVMLRTVMAPELDWWWYVLPADSPRGGDVYTGRRSTSEIKIRIPLSNCNSKGCGKGQFIRPMAWDVVQREVVFPAPSDININMMPFRMGDPSSIPKEYQQYQPLIEACDLPRSELGKIGFLTIQESLVPECESQRRSGIHIERPGYVMNDGGTFFEGYWGLGTTDIREGGIYMASTVSDSCDIWNCLIDEPAQIVGEHGSLEHIRYLLKEGEPLRANELIWFTDATPHESKPMAVSTYRQYFRLVTSSVKFWYAKHSTVNPLGVVPDPSVTEIVTYDKFDTTWI